MDDAAFSEEFLRFLRAVVPTVDAAELLLLVQGEPQRWWAGPEALDANVGTLAQAYRERPVTLIRVIYALRDSRIQSFADAFRLRRS